MAKHEIYVSTDIETNGPVAGLNSMLSFGSAAFTAEGLMLGKFSANLELLEGTEANPDTMAFWANNQAAYEATRVNVMSPGLAMQDYDAWLSKLPGKPIFVGYPAAFDFSFIYYYLVRFRGRSLFSFSALDIKTYAMALLDQKYSESSKRNMLKSWFSDGPHTHIALEDAIEQGRLFCNMLAYRRGTGQPAGVDHDDEVYIPIKGGAVVAFPSYEREPDGPTQIRLVDANGVQLALFASEHIYGGSYSVETIGALLGFMRQGKR